MPLRGTECDVPKNAESRYVERFMQIGKEIIEHTLYHRL